ncbi:ABC transporter substrate-binding protein, partial [Paenibacillus sepulcri]|nr:ABC transporter substrate-binding protein [Paenibacillus sepulcri]
LPETKEALAKLRDWYAKGWIDKEMGIRKDSAEPIVSGKAGMFSAPWWMGYGPIVDMVKTNPDANMLAYTLPLDKDGEYNPHINAPTTEFLVVRKGFGHPEAIAKINNVVFRDSDKLESDTGLDPGLSPLRLVMSRYDKFEGSVKLLQEVLAGEKPKEVLADQPYDPNLPNEYDAILKVKLEPYDNPSIEYWNPEADWGAFARAYCRLIGVAPLIDKPMNKVGSLIYSQTKSMESKWANLEKLESETFMNIIMGFTPLDSFDQFVADWKKQGGDQITAEVEEFIKE